MAPLGDALAATALVFAVLEMGSAAGLGIVLAARQGVKVVVLELASLLAVLNYLHGLAHQKSGSRSGRESRHVMGVPRLAPTLVG